MYVALSGLNLKELSARHHGSLKRLLGRPQAYNSALSVWRSNVKPLCNMSSLRTFMATTRSLSSEQLFEEETLPGYDPDQFYPVHIGETLGLRYAVIGKLGFGANSTVWFCRDSQTGELVAVKVYVRTPQGALHREQVAHEHLASVQSSHPGQARVRQPLDTFDIRHKNGDFHLCLVYQPMHASMLDLQRLGGNPRNFPEDLTKSTLQHLLEALDFMHTEAKMVHCDIKLSNIMLQIEDCSVLSAFVEDETANPSPRKTIDAKRTIYASRKFRHPRRHAFGPPTLCDLGEARIGTSFPFTNIQPDLYKAPEILLTVDWNQSVDIWNIACLAWDMVQGSHHLFDGRDEEGLHNNRVHLGEMVGLIGHPPLDFQRRSENAWRVFDAQGKWKGDPPILSDTLESRLKGFHLESKVTFLAFLRSMLRWRPEDRPIARMLLDDPWLNS
ncbi:hypothetical protein DOTSEDRAFT_73941 [Dothistroma septosporum NZE10]|uniref:Protein kinase domain-containing protein n=1 Tax=Dothistroma septosporum (strain NZE10 / CBS 128990) TaxID=675120 RepID=N1PJL3_DOTSN|nr:hypothetical protein DOTSEDRAFT_73941 [Dothistroma septosporum NZE10]